MKRTLLQPAYVLHRRPYRESSFLVELFTPEYGRLTAIAKGVRKARSATQGLLQPFTPLFISWTGKGELPILTEIEMNGAALLLRGECLFAGFYLNELLICLLQKWDPHTNLYKVYEKTLQVLQAQPLEEKTLRIFEKYLLEDLGYGLLPKVESIHHVFKAEMYYRFVPEQGLVVSKLGDQSGAKTTIFSGKNLIAITKEEWENEEILQDAKRLTRLILAPLLGARPLHSRRLFVHPYEEKAYEK